MDRLFICSTGLPNDQHFQLHCFGWENMCCRVSLCHWCEL